MVRVAFADFVDNYISLVQGRAFSSNLLKTILSFGAFLNLLQKTHTVTSVVSSGVSSLMTSLELTSATLWFRHINAFVRNACLCACAFEER